MPTLKAEVQYGDFHGSVAADVSDNSSLSKMLKERDLLLENEFVVAVSLYVGESGKARPPQPSVTAYVMDISGHRDLPAALEANPVPTLREIDIDVTLDEFFGFFKRFSVVIERGRGLIGREYNVAS